MALLQSEGRGQGQSKNKREPLKIGGDFVNKTEVGLVQGNAQFYKAVGWKFNAENWRLKVDAFTADKNQVHTLIQFILFYPVNNFLLVGWMVALAL